MYILDFIPSYFAVLLQLTKTRILSKIAYLIHTIRISVSSRYQQIYRIGDSFISIFDSSTTCSLTLYSSLRSVQAAIVRYMYIPITLSSTRPSHKPPFFVILLIILIIILLLLLLLNKYNSTTLQLYKSTTLQLSNSTSLQVYIFQHYNSPTLQLYIFQLSNFPIFQLSNSTSYQPTRPNPPPPLLLQHAASPDPAKPYLGSGRQGPKDPRTQGMYLHATSSKQQNILNNIPTNPRGPHPSMPLFFFFLLRVFIHPSPPLPIPPYPFLAVPYNKVRYFLLPNSFISSQKQKRGVRVTPRRSSSSSSSSSKKKVY